MAKKDNSDVNESFLQLLECPVCMSYMSAPIFMCNNGHNICSTCRKEVKICPTCRGKYSDIKNIALQDLAEQIHYPCDNMKAGCKQGILLADMEIHKNSCPFRIYNCILGGAKPCEWKGARYALLSHIESEHKNRLFSRGHELPLQIQNYDVNKNRLLPLALHVHNELFWCIQRTIPEDKSLNISVHYIGPQENCVKYLYEVEYYSEDKSYLSLFRSVTQPDFVDFLKIGEKKTCSTIHSDMLDHFVSKNKLQCKIRIIVNNNLLDEVK